MKILRGNYAIDGKNEAKEGDTYVLDFPKHKVTGVRFGDGPVILLPAEPVEPTHEAPLIIQ